MKEGFLLLVNFVRNCSQMYNFLLNKQKKNNKKMFEKLFKWKE